MQITKIFQEKFNGTDIYKYVITDRITVEISELGATIISLKAPTVQGDTVDVIAGYDTASGMVGEGLYRGATIGRYANRIGGGKFSLNGKTYSLALNDGGKAHLHGGEKGFNVKVFRSKEEKDGVCFYYDAEDGEEGYPGNLEFCVKFCVSGTTLNIEYFAKSDTDTLFNPTNHAFFNLNGEKSGDVLDVELKINADKYLPVDKNLIPTGEERRVSGTPFDFTDYKPIGKDIKSDDEQIKAVNGYDHNFCLNSNFCASAYSSRTGIVLDCFTDMSGVQLYTSNEKKIFHGKSDYGEHSAFCLETQFYPDSVNNPQWKSPVLKKSENFYSKTSYAFSVKADRKNK